MNLRLPKLIFKFVFLLAFIVGFSACNAVDDEQRLVRNEWFFEELAVEAYIHSDRTVSFFEDHRVRFRGSIYEYEYEIYTKDGFLDEESLVVSKNGVRIDNFYIESENEGKYIVGIPVSYEGTLSDPVDFRFEYEVHDFISDTDGDLEFFRTVLDSTRRGGAQGVSYAVVLDPVYQFLEGTTIRGNELDRQYQRVDDYTTLFVGENIDSSENFIVRMVFSDE